MESPKVPLHFLILVHFWGTHCQKSPSALRRIPSPGEFLDVCHGWLKPGRISWSWLLCCQLDNLVQSQAMRKPCVLCFDLCCCTWRCPRNFLHLDLRTFLKRTSAWKCIVMLDLPLCKLLRGEALLVVIVFRRVVLKCFSRHQASVTLSSCEAELVAIQAAVQEARCHNRFNEVMFTVAFCRQFPFQFHSETIWIFHFLAGRMPLNCALITVGTFGRGNQVLLRWSLAFSQAPTLAHPMNGRGEGAILCIGTFPLRSMWQNSLRCCLQHVGGAACWNNRTTNLWPCKQRILQSFLENDLWLRHSSTQRLQLPT